MDHRYKAKIAFDELVRQLEVPTFVLAADGRVLVWNHACELLTGMLEADVIGTTDHWRAFYDEQRPCLADLILAGETQADAVAALYETSNPSDVATGGLHANNWCRMPLQGLECYLSIDAAPIYDAEGKLIAVVETLRDWTLRKNTEDNFRLIDAVFEGSSKGIIITDDKARIIRVNPAFCEMTGYLPEEIIGSEPDILKSGVHGDAFYEEMWRELVEDGDWRGEIWNRRKNGEVVPETLSIYSVRDSAGKVCNYVGMFSDISEHMEAQERLVDITTHDALTGLPNRLYLMSRLQKVLATARARENMIAVCFVDLDELKAVNDQHGNETGDAVLIEVTQRLKKAVRSSDIVARIGGDEFILLLSDFDRMEEIEIAMERVLDMLRQTLEVGSTKINISASIGVTVHPFDNSDADTLIRHADQAMFIAKNMGCNTWHLHDAADEQAARRIGAMLSQVREALNNNEFRLYYQPKVNLRKGNIVGMEALIRWQREDGEIVPPLQFLPHVENSPLIVDLGEWVLREALRQVRFWLSQGLIMQVSVNIAARQFQHIDFIKRLSAILNEFPDVPAGLLEIEVLESTAFDDVDYVRKVLIECRHLGVGFALDDFGTGFSTLTYLRRLPARSLKIDQTFIHDMLEDNKDLALVEGVIGLAEVFRMDVLAEGVETLEQGIVLMRIGCDVIQGYYIARPMPADQVIDWCANYVPSPLWGEWANTSWDRDLMPLVLAEDDYFKWLGRLIAVLDDTEGKQADVPLAEVIDPRTCRFVRWYEQKGRAQFGHLPEFVHIDNIRMRIDELAGSIMQFRATGKTEAARRRLDELLELKDSIAERFGALQGILLKQGQHSG